MVLAVRWSACAAGKCQAQGAGAHPQDGVMLSEGTSAHLDPDTWRLDRVPIAPADHLGEESRAGEGKENMRPQIYSPNPGIPRLEMTPHNFIFTSHRVDGSSVSPPGVYIVLWAVITAFPQ